MGDRVAKDALYDGFAEVAKALGNGRRAEFVDVLAQGERHVEEIAAEIDQSVANTSFHLRALASVGLVATRRDGTRIYYRLASDRVGDLWAALRQVAVAHHEAARRARRAYLGNRDGSSRSTATSSPDRLARRRSVVVDVRPEVEYSAPATSQAARFDPDRAAGAPAAARCHPMSRSSPTAVGPYCVFADDAVRLLRRRGRRARRLDDGFPEWQRAGLPVASEKEGIQVFK